MPRQPVNLESPHTGEELHVMYARFCVRDSMINHGEAPFAPHLIYPQENILHDGEENLGVECAKDFSIVTNKTIVYVDLGMSPEMLYAARDAQYHNHTVELRFLPEDMWKEFTAAATAKNIDVPKTAEIITGSRFLHL